MRTKTLAILAIALAALAFCNVAHAEAHVTATTMCPSGFHVLTVTPDVVACAPDAIADAPADSVPLVTSLWEGGQIPQAIIIVAFVGLVLATKRFPWLARDHRGVKIGTLIGVLAILADAAARGVPPSFQLVVSAVLGSTMLGLNPKAPAAVEDGNTIGDALTSQPPEPPADMG